MSKPTVKSASVPPQRRHFSQQPSRDNSLQSSAAPTRPFITTSVAPACSRPRNTPPSRISHFRFDFTTNRWQFGPEHISQSASADQGTSSRRAEERRGVGAVGSRTSHHPSTMSLGGVHARRAPPSLPSIRASSFAVEEATVAVSLPSPSPLSPGATTREKSLMRSQSVSDGTRLPTCHQITESVFIGTFEDAANTTWLCSAQIAYIVNLTGVPRIKVRGCPCPDAAYHTPIEYVPQLDTTSEVRVIIDRFLAINDFIAEARAKKSRVLVFNNDGHDLCQAVALQFLMEYFKLLKSHAIQHLQKHTNSARIRISENYMAALDQMESMVENGFFREGRSYGSLRPR